MSLETSLAENTAAVVALTAALLSRDPQNTALVSTPTIRISKKAATKQTEGTSAGADTFPTSAECQPTVHSYELAATAISALAQQKGRDVAVALLGQFGAARLPDVPADNLGEVTAAANKALGMAA